MTITLATPTADMSIQQVAVDRAIKLLTAAKASFAVQMPDGSFTGDLIVLAKTARRKINDWRVDVPGYIDQIKTMQVGDVVTWSFDSRDRAEAFRSTVSSQGVHHHGKGAVTTCLNGDSVEAMRVE
jgi:hypothetical protein